MIKAGILSIILKKTWKIPLFILAIPVVMAVRLIRPWLLLRFGTLNSTRIGHFAAGTELYLCERDAGINLPSQRHVDLVCMINPICNRQLATMWRRHLRVWPIWILGPIIRINKLISGGAVHEIGSSLQSDRDVHNLLDRFPPYLQFTQDEVAKGEAGLRAMGIPLNASYICLIVRDNAYLDSHLPDGWSYHNYRNCNIRNYVLAAEELANRGYFVVRMGAKVLDPIKSSHLRVLDYATNGTRSEFMDIYLGANCYFCISNGTGFDAIPQIFRRPIVYVDQSPFGCFMTSSAKFLATSKKCWLRNEKRFLTFKEILDAGLAHCIRGEEYEKMGWDLIESTPEEIAAVVLEMEARLKGSWRTTEEDEELQRRFWEIYPKKDKAGRLYHGEIRSRVGTAYLRQNRAGLVNAETISPAGASELREKNSECIPCGLSQV